MSFIQNVDNDVNTSAAITSNFSIHSNRQWSNINWLNQLMPCFQQ